MPMTLGPIVMSGIPGSGSFWLQQVLQEPKTGLGLMRGDLKPTITVKKVDCRAWDRHCPGSCTATIVRCVPEILRCWFMRFRKTPPTLMQIAADPLVMHGGKHYVYIGGIHQRMKYMGDDFDTYCKAYITKSPGALSRLLARFTENAKHILHQEYLREGTIKMLHEEGIKFDEQKIMDYPSLTVETRKKPPWDEGLLSDILRVG